MLFFSMHASGSISIEFERETVLGKGGYGVAYEGEWNNKRVAVKRIVLAQCENNEREKEALKWLDHPNVVKFYHVESDDDFR
jgi:serine/threonine protein kinase